MPHNRLNTGFGRRQPSKQVSTVARSSSSVAKYRLCVASRRASFHTRSMGASCGEYGGRNSSVRMPRYWRSNGANKTAWWYRALSSTMTIRWPCERCRNSFRRKASKVAALNTGHIERTNFPVRRLTAPKQATDFRVGACTSTGSLISGDTHMRVRVQCCWKWHSSRLQSSMSRRFARRRSFFKRRNPQRVRLGDLRTGLAQPKPHLVEHPLALAHPQRNAITAFHVFAQKLAVPQVLRMTKFTGASAQVPREPLPSPRLQRAWPPRPLSLAQSVESVFLETADPTLDRAGVFAEQSGDLPATLPRGHQQYAVQSVVVARFVRAFDLLLKGNPHHVGILNFESSHGDVSVHCRHRQYSRFIRHYLCRYV